VNEQVFRAPSATASWHLSTVSIDRISLSFGTRTNDPDLCRLCEFVEIGLLKIVDDSAAGFYAEPYRTFADALPSVGLIAL
jgi:hypothetical protein